MPEIKLEKPLSVPAVPAREALSAILHGIAGGNEAWADFALHLNTGAMGLPDIGYVAVPIRLEVTGETAEPRHEIRFLIRSQRSPELFPVFDGGAGIDPTGPSSSTLWLAGSYEVPISGFGSLINATLMLGAAYKTLENFLEDLTEATIARVERRELAQLRYRFFS